MYLLDQKTKHSHNNINCKFSATHDFTEQFSLSYLYNCHIPSFTHL